MKRRALFRAIGVAVALALTPVTLNVARLRMPEETRMYVNGIVAAAWSRVLSMNEIEALFDADQAYAPTNKALEFLQPQYVAVVSDDGDDSLQGKIWRRGGTEWTRFSNSSKATVERVLHGWLYA